VRRMTPFWSSACVLVIVLFLLFTAGDLAAEGAQGDTSGLSYSDSPGGAPDTLWGGPSSPGDHTGDPNDYDKTLPPSPGWLWFANWLLGIGL
jgi:hypothetical protein